VYQKTPSHPLSRGANFPSQKWLNSILRLGLKGAKKLSVQSIAKYLPCDNSDLATEMIKFGLNR